MTYKHVCLKENPNNDFNQKSQGSGIIPLCSSCQTSLSKLSPKSWEKNKQKVKNGAKYCKHDESGNYYFYDNDKKLMVRVQPFTFNLECEEMRSRRCSKCKFSVWFTDHWGDHEEMDNQHEWNNNSLVHKGHNDNNSLTNQLSNNQYLTIFQNILSYFTSKNIHSITNQNGNLVITFNQNQTNPNSPPPPPQTITEEELSETSTLMEPEQKSMWKKIKECFKKIGKNSIDKQELEQEINKLKTQTEQNSDKPVWPWIIGGIGIIAVVGIVIALVKSKKNKKL